MSAESGQSTSKALVRAGWVIGGIPSLFLLAAAGANIARPAAVVEGTVKIGFPESAILPLGIVLLVSTVLYLVPRTCVLGAVLLTGYLGGAVATHVHIGDPFLTKTLIPVYFGVALWLGLVLKDARLRALLPVRL